ncbi:MAG: 23S rRNA (guanosine(2251)-2'-O)-methyltransferase RlmB [Bacteroidales bacterium]|nr:23S rRNA (guanosine(2251)-2'-O)-methyltransferase RlmB [Bacteroidales bacterium]NLK81497.1 23S rRNA (guanosine(2251)-2'-O)-methyltransferase RlmB [Bacteroidales bacterium]HPY82390.1 23S rRNA (guanosine(2251)-2'-O)-methyltransferase RlmB [Bacteroidales bacterium]
MAQNNVIIGIHAVHEALKDSLTLDQILIKKNANNEIIREIIYLARKQTVTVKTVPVEKINRITRKNHQGVIAFSSPVDFHNITNLVPSIFEKGAIPLFVILDQITDVRNFGAIVRSCECFGVNGIIIPQKGAAQIGEDAVKTSAGALYKVPISKVHSLPSCIDFLQQSGISVLSITEKSSTSLYTIDCSVPLALVFGAEDVGISSAILQKSDACVNIPMQGEISSLNVSVAAGIGLYEVLKQRPQIL